MESQGIKKIRMVFFDNDGVIYDDPEQKESGKKTHASTWNTVFDVLGIYGRHEILRDKFENGEYGTDSPYMKWTDEACQEFKQNRLKENKFMEIIDSRPFMVGAKETIQELKNRGYQTAIITGSFKALAERAQKALGIDYIVAHCDLKFNKKGELESWKLTDCDYEGKVHYFEELAKKHKLLPSQCAYVGHEVNDVPILKEAGLPIAFNCYKDSVLNAAKMHIEKKDLREILTYLPPIKRI